MFPEVETCLIKSKVVCCIIARSVDSKKEICLEVPHFDRFGFSVDLTG